MATVEEPAPPRRTTFLHGIFLGLGIPFLLMGLGIGQASPFLRRTLRAMRVVTVVSGVSLVLGVLILTNSLGWLSQRATLKALSI